MGKSISKSVADKEPWFSEYSHRWPVAALPLGYAMACVEIALRESETARTIYAKIADAWVNPNVVGALKESREQMMSYLSDEEKRVLNEGMVNPGKFIKPENMDEPFNALKELFSSKLGNCDWSLIGESSPQEQTESFEALSEFVMLIFEFVLKGFNRESDVANENYKVVPWGGTPWLVLATMFKAGLDSYQITTNRIVEIYKTKNVKGKIINYEEVLTKQPTSPRHRKMVKKSKEANMKLRHDKKFLDVAWLWYQCRVKYSGIEDYINSEAKKRDKDIDVKNLQKRLKLCDDAIGYLRHGNTA